MMRLSQFLKKTGQSGQVLEPPSYDMKAVTKELGIAAIDSTLMEFEPRTLDQ